MQSHVYAEFAHIERVHWWFKARRGILDSILSAFVPKKASNCLDIGSGPAINAIMLKRHAQRLTLLEPSIEGVTMAKENLPEATIIHGFFPQDRPDAKYELITAFDVIEHIEDDKSAITAIAGMLQPNGITVITVPAYNWLWSEHDDVVHHKRRYTKDGLQELMESSGLVVEKISYFNFLLFLPISAARFLLRASKKKREATDFSLTPSFINIPLQYIFSLERYLLKWSSLPFGISILCVARKKAV
ncbi:class I SAM-dependent methyltransferase [Nibrella viscosa]|uniref:Class I SAM-dependent methyltransferase n=1 Tax=Nibrella viscosa TaxID=1084524 RepID=A0ABP8KKX4_9BACT